MLDQVDDVRPTLYKCYTNVLSWLVVYRVYISEDLKHIMAFLFTQYDLTGTVLGFSYNIIDTMYVLQPLLCSLF